MNAGLISVRYAKALFGACKKDDEMMATIHDDCRFLLDSLRESDELVHFMSSPIVKPGAKKQILNNTFGKRLHKYSLRFLELIIDNNREPLLINALIDFIDLYRAYKSIRSVTIITAVEVSAEFREEVREFLEESYKSSIELECKVNPDIVGGMIFISDGKQIDSSISGQLRALKKEMMIY